MVFPILGPLYKAGILLIWVRIRWPEFWQLPYEPEVLVWLG